MIVVVDRYGKIVRGNFPSREAAEVFKTTKGNKLWRIREIHTTDRQKRAVKFCEAWLQIEFKGDIENSIQVSRFLSLYLETAKLQAMELACEYEAYIQNLD